MMTFADICAIVGHVRFQDRHFLVMEKGDGFLVQMEYQEPDVYAPEAGKVSQKTRKWYVSPHMTESEIVETCWAMVCRSQLHIAGEHFTYEGRRLFSQHFDVRARIKVHDEFELDRRK